MWEAGGLDYNHREELLKNPLPLPPANIILAAVIVSQQQQQQQQQHQQQEPGPCIFSELGQA